MILIGRVFVCPPGSTARRMAELGRLQIRNRPLTHSATKPNSAWWRYVKFGQCNPPVARIMLQVRQRRWSILLTLNLKKKRPQCGDTEAVILKDRQGAARRSSLIQGA